MYRDIVTLKWVQSFYDIFRYLKKGCQFGDVITGWLLFPFYPIAYGWLRHTDRDCEFFLLNIISKHQFLDGVHVHNPFQCGYIAII